MKHNNSVVYERITVLAIHILNASEIPFEKDGRMLLERYQRFLFDCSEIMRRQSGCMDILIFHNRISCVYAGCRTETVKKAAEAAMQIENLAKRRSGMIMGMGIASGTAAMISVSVANTEIEKRVWLGPAVEKADFLSHAAIDYGERRILAEHKIYESVCGYIKAKDW